jgi:RimJ/RimL family protein N-acetyltransferase
VDLSPALSRTYAPADWPTPLEPLTLLGARVRLEPITADAPPALVDEVDDAIADESVWRYLTSDVHTTELARAYVADLVDQWRAGTTLSFAVRLVAPGRAECGRVVGATRLKDAVRAHRRLGVGSWFVPAVWGAGANAEAKGLLLAHAFDGLGALRVEFQTDVRNLRSRAALAALGAVEEGVLRAHRIRRDGGLRDSVLFRVSVDEWPAVRERIARRLATQGCDGAPRASSLPTLDGLTFRPAELDPGSALSSETVFRFHEDGGRVWADYAGGSIARGFLAGVRDRDALMFRYVQLAADGRVDAGESRCEVARDATGITRLMEAFAWATRDGAGRNVFVSFDRGA